MKKLSLFLGVVSFACAAATFAHAQRINTDPKVLPEELREGRLFIGRAGSLGILATDEQLALQAEEIERQDGTGAQAAKRGQEPSPQELAKNLPKMQRLSDEEKARSIQEGQREKAETQAPIYLEELSAENGEVAHIQVEILFAGDESRQNRRWPLNVNELPLFLGKLLSYPEENSLPSQNIPAEGYQGFSVDIHMKDGSRKAPIHIYRDQIRMYGTHPYLYDPERDMEFWLASTTKTFGQYDLVSRALEPTTFDACMQMGFRLIESEPRQCVLPTEVTFLDKARPLSAATVPVTDFASCAVDPYNPVVNTFPRKCVAPGGRIYMEPPKPPQPVE